MKNIFVFGDSITYGKWDSQGGWVARLRKAVDAKYNFDGKRGGALVYALGVPGELAIEMVERAERELAARLDARKESIVIYATGINDSCPNNRKTGERTPPEAFRQAISRLIEIGRKHGCEVLFIGLTPVNPEKSQGLAFSNEAVREYDGYISEACAAESVAKLDVFDDLLAASFPDLLVDAAHPNDEGHALLAQKVIEFLESRDLL